MSYSKVRLTVQAIRAKNIHYAVSTGVAILYAMIWFLTTGVHADISQSTVSMASSEISNDASRATGSEDSQAELATFTVWGERDATEATTVAALDEFVIQGTRSTADSSAASTVVTANAKKGDWHLKTPNWLKFAR